MASELTFKPMGSRITARKGLERVADVDPRLTRSNYFDNKLLTAEDLNRDQLYLDGRLREVGQTLGHGIIQGLELSLDDLDGSITVTPGLAMSQAGRVLELGRRLTINLGERTTISERNEGQYRRFDRGLYAVFLSYAEVGTDIAEVFPVDLGDKRGFQYDVISEGVQVGLVRLALPLAQQHPLYIRANLIRELYADYTAGGVISEDAVALGLLAISDDRPQWLDAELLRQPLRPFSREEGFQQDLFRRYQGLFSDVMAERGARSLGGDFAATDYFSLLPPVGLLPKESLSPVTGRQGYFPENFRVWTAPLRKSEVELVRKESMALPPIDLALEEPVDIIVLTPLSNTDYGHYAQRLERPYNVKTRRLPMLDLLRLRLYPRRPVHELDTDETTWQAIWDAVSEEDLFYIRRPLRTAETSISGIVLAQGADLPAIPPSDTLPSPADGGLLQDEDSVLLNRINVGYLSGLRPPASDEGREAVTVMELELGADALVVQQSLGILLRVERIYDDVIWQTLLSLVHSEQLTGFHAQLIAGQEDGTATGEVVADIGAAFGLDAGLLSEWSAAVPD